MKKRNVLQIIFFAIALMMLNQFTNAQKCNNGHPCPAGYYCSNGTCISVPCYPGCPTGYVCSNGKCVSQFCSPPCPAGYNCANGTCIFNIHYCSPPCPSGYICLYGHCGKGPNRVSELPIEKGESLDINIYPNPVSNSGTISFSLEQPEKVSLKVFDLNGRLVKTLADEEIAEGEHQLVWNASDVNAGVYLLQFQSADNLQTEKLIVTK